MPTSPPLQTTDNKFSRGSLVQRVVPALFQKASRRRIPPELRLGIRPLDARRQLLDCLILFLGCDLQVISQDGHACVNLPQT